MVEVFYVFNHYIVQHSLFPHAPTPPPLPANRKKKKKENSKKAIIPSCAE